MGIDDKFVSSLIGYSSLSSFGQIVFTKSSVITRKFKNGDKIAEEYLKIAEISDFDKSKNDFIYKINQKIGQKDLEEFKNILSETISSIKENGWIK